LSYVAIAIKKLSSTEPVWLISFFFSLSILILSFFTFYQNWIMPSFIDLFLLSMIGILGGLANLWLSQSYKFSEVSLVTPLKYLALVFAIIFGYFIWDEVPTSKTIIGSLLVISSSFIIFKREMVLQKELSRQRHE
jgi:drug/metabolite transporter (DMT)-like permease